MEASLIYGLDNAHIKDDSHESMTLSGLLKLYIKHSEFLVLMPDLDFNARKTILTWHKNLCSSCGWNEWRLSIAIIFLFEESPRGASFHQTTYISAQMVVKNMIWMISMVWVLTNMEKGLCSKCWFWICQHARLIIMNECLAWFCS